jgi:uncharacterized glyoxalase superfamily protein PhnB
LHRKLIDVNKVYTTTADFDEGDNIINVNTLNNEVSLTDGGQPFDFIWVAASARGTVVKINTNTGEILGEYRTTPDSQGWGSPSRTTVDKYGSVWCANRNDVYCDEQGCYGSVIHIGLEENGQCKDRNGNGVIDTSMGLADIKPWTTTDPLHPNLALQAEDECIIHYVNVSSSGTRHVSVNKDNDVWVGGSNCKDFNLIKGGGPDVPTSGTIVPGKSYSSVGFGGYGGLISGDVIWSANPLLRWNTSLPLTGVNGDPAGANIGPPFADTNWAGQYDLDSYGLCLDRDGNVWNTALSGNQVVKYAADGQFLASYAHGNYYAQGCVVDSRPDGTGDVWIAHSLLNLASVGHLKKDGTYVGTVILPGEDGTTGVAVDTNGKIWATNIYSDSVSRIDPALGPIGND